MPATKPTLPAPQKHVRRLSAIAALCIFLLPAGAGADVQTDVSELATLKARSETVSASLTGALGVMPGLAVSPSTVFVIMSGAGLACEHVALLDGTSLCNNPLLQQASRAASTWTFAFACAFALLLFLANTGKLQGVLGKALKVLEVVPALGAGLPITTQALASGPAPTVQTASFGSSLIVASTLASLSVMIVARLAVEFLVWLSPIPFVDFVLEVGARVLAVALVALWLIHPALATFVCLLLVAAALAMLRWAVRVLGFVHLVAVRPLWAALHGTETGPVDPSGPTEHQALSQVTLALPVAVLACPGIKKWTTGFLVRSSEGAVLYFRTLGRTRRKPLLLAEVQTKSRPWWSEVQGRDLATGGPARLVIGRERAHLLAEVTRAVGGEWEPQTPQPSPASSLANVR